MLIFTQGHFELLTDHYSAVLFQYSLLCFSVKPVVKVKPDQHVFRGERVTLTCDIQGGEDIQWTYRWMKNGSVISHTEREIKSVSDGDKYSCEATRSDISDGVTLTVSGESSYSHLFNHHLFSAIKLCMFRTIDCKLTFRLSSVRECNIHISEYIIHCDFKI